MKKQLTTLLLFCAITIGLRAQILNTSFENLNPNSTIQHWGPAMLMAFAIDSAGNPVDSLKIDQGFCFSSNDAHTGSRALEMRNAQWVTAGDVIPGRARMSSNDSDFFSYSNPPVPVGPKPINFTFYYKFSPVGNDTAYASMILTDSTSNEVGSAIVEIVGTHSVYAFSSTQIVYTSTVAPVFVAIDFRTAKPNSPAHYGTRFLVDDVNATTATVSTTGLATLKADNRISCFPNPANKELNLLMKKTNPGSDFHLQVITTDGKRVDNLSYSKNGNALKINIEALAPGLYFINVIHDGTTYTARFAKTE